MTQGGQGELPRLGNYQLMRQIGRGGFADVYLGKHVNLQTYAAVKILKADFPTQEIIDEFLSEAQTIAELTHPNIVRVLDFDVQDDLAFLVMDYAPYGSLRTQYALRTHVPLEAVLSYVHQVAAALQYAHQHRIIHCDVKPENMLVGRDYRILLSDFGLATISALSQSMSAQQPGEVAGTIAYIAPEQLQGKPRPASDQYALAVSAYEWICGRRPFIGTITEVMSQHMHNEPAPLHVYAPGVALGVEQVILQALEKDPRQRFRSVMEFSESLDAAAGVTPRSPEKEHFTTQFGGGKPTNRQTIIFPQQSGGSRSGRSEGSLPISRPSRPSRPSRSDRDLASVGTVLQNQGVLEGASPEDEERPVRHLSRRNLLIALAGIGAGGVGAVALASFVFHPESGGSPVLTSKSTPTATATATKAAAKPSPTATKASQPTPTATEATPKPSPTKVISTPVTPPAGTIATTYNLSTKVASVAWSPNGTSIAASALNSVRIQQTSSTSTVVLQGHAGAVNTVAWSLDGTRIASGSTDKTVRLWNAATGALLSTYQGHTGAVNAVAWSPDGARVVSGSADKTVRLWNAATGALLVTNGDHTNSVTSVAWSPDGNYIISGSTDTTVQIWNIQTGQKSSYRGHSGAVNAVACSSDSTMIASGGTDKTVQVYSVGGVLISTCQGHTAAVNAVAWAPAGTYIASASADSTIRIWHASTGVSQRSPFQGYAALYSVGWSPDSTHLVSGDDNFEIIWK